MSTNEEGATENLECVPDPAIQPVPDPEGYNPEAARVHRNVAMLFLVFMLLLASAVTSCVIFQEEINAYLTSAYELARPYFDRAVDYVRSWLS